MGTCLTDSYVHFPSLRNTLVDLWHPIGGIAIPDIGERRFLFKFFYAVDLKRVLDGLSWFFNNHLLLLREVLSNEDPLTINLYQVVFWIQVHDLPPGFMSEVMGCQFGDFLGNFLEYDSKSLSMGLYWYMQIRVRLEIRLPLKRRKKIQFGEQFYYVNFKYEKLSLFYFIRGKLGHGESSD